MSVISINLNADADLRAFSKNPIFEKPTSLHCCWCKNQPGRRKTYRTLYQLFMHFNLQHKGQPRNLDFVKSIAVLIHEGLL